MKKIIVLAICLFTFNQAFSQFFVGPRAGINLANMSSDNAAYDNSSIIGIVGGATAKWQFSNFLSLRMDALYSQRGTSSAFTVASGGTTVETTSKIVGSYLAIPLMADYEIPLKKERLVPYRIEPGTVALHLYAGGFFGYALSATSDISTKTTSGGSITETPAVSTTLDAANYNAIDFGAVLGAGISFDLTTRSKLYLDARYNLGLSDFNNYSAAPTGTPKFTNRPIEVTLAYEFSLTNRRHVRYTW